VWAVSERIETLLSEGLGHFVKGDNAAAVACWETVLAEEPNNTRAREFMAYVRTTTPPAASSTPPTQPEARLSTPGVFAALPSVQQVEASPSAGSLSKTDPAMTAVQPRDGMMVPPAGDLSTSPTVGRMPAVQVPQGRSPTGEWFRDAVQTSGGEKPLRSGPGASLLTPLPGDGFTPPPLTPGVQPIQNEGYVSAPGFLSPPAPDPLLQQVIHEMRSTGGSANASTGAPVYAPLFDVTPLPPVATPPPPSFTPPPPARESPDKGVAAMARGASLFGDAVEEIAVIPPPPPPGAGAVPPAGPWEAVMSPAPVGAESTNDSGEIDVTVEEDANADGLGSMWSSMVPHAQPTPAPSPSPPVTPVPAAAVTSPWDDGGVPTTGVVDLDRSGKAVPRSSAKFSTTPRTATPGVMGTASSLESRCASMMARVKELHDLGDFSGSLEIVEKVLELDSKNAQARDFMERNEETLLKMYESKLGSLEKTPRLQMSPEQIIWLNLHAKAGFVLSRVDGMATFEDVMSLSAMPRLDTVRILAQLLQTGVIVAA
jgi:hypothetical protein